MKEAWDKIFPLIANEKQGDEVEVQLVEMSLIKSNPYQPRQEFNEQKIDELAQSIKTYGLLQPVILRKCSDGFQLVAGERRYLACKKLKWKRIHAIVNDFTDSALAAISLIENLQRENLNFIEEARGYEKLLVEFNLTQEVLAQRLGKSQSTIANKLRLLKLPDQVKEMLVEKELTERHARALLKLHNADDQKKLLAEIIEKGLTVNQTEKRIAAVLERYTKKKRKAGQKKVVVRDLRIFLNTIRQAVNEIQKYGLQPEVNEEDYGDYWEVRIKLPKTGRKKVRAKM